MVTSHLFHFLFLNLCLILFLYNNKILPITILLGFFDFSFLLPFRSFPSNRQIPAKFTEDSIDTPGKLSQVILRPLFQSLIVNLTNLLPWFFSPYGFLFYFIRKNAIKSNSTIHKVFPLFYFTKKKPFKFEFFNWNHNMGFKSTTKKRLTFLEVHIVLIHFTNTKENQ
jgi:hypothetical protein